MPNEPNNCCLHRRLYFAGKTFFCSQGGLKAVIWTDVFQSLIMVAGLIVVVIVGSIEVGGFDQVWKINDAFGRLNFFE